MKSSSMLDPELTPEDFALVEALESRVERYFREHTESTLVTFSVNRSDGFQRRHMNEAVRRIRAAGWTVTATGAQLAIERPPLGEVETVVRLRVGAAASNLVALVQLVGVTPVEGAIDVYLDDLGLDRLVTMHRLGVRFSSKLRLLTSPAGAKKLAKTFVRDALSEMGCDHGEVRVTPAKGHEGRFLFLAGAGVVSLGCSLNKVDVNERAFRTGDLGDRADFETRWMAATPHV